MYSGSIGTNYKFVVVHEDGTEFVNLFQGFNSWGPYSISQLDSPVVDYYSVIKEVTIGYRAEVNGFGVWKRLVVSLDEEVKVRTQLEAVRALRLFGFDIELEEETAEILANDIQPTIRCINLNDFNDTTEITVDVSDVPESMVVRHIIIDGDPGDIYITINAGEGSLAPFNDLDPFYQDRVRSTVERVLLETDGTSIREFALLSDFFHTSLETMDLNELVEILTHVATVGRD